jgi:hypothetical protein
MPVIRLKRGTAANWTSANPVLAAGEAGVETDTRKIKYGDGTTAWNALGYGKAEADIADASESVKGIMRFATDAEVSAGTEPEAAVTPAQLAAATEITEIDGGVV